MNECNLTRTDEGSKCGNQLIKTGLMCLLDLIQGKGEEWDAVGMSCTLFGIAVRRCKCGRTG